MQEIEQLKEFLEGDTRGRRLQGDCLMVYVRRATRVSPDGAITPTLDIADVEAFERGKGHFTQFLDEVEKISPYPIYIENVGEERFRNFFRKRGYQQVDTTITPSFFFNPSKR